MEPTAIEIVTDGTRRHPQGCGTPGRVFGARNVGTRTADLLQRKSLSRLRLWYTDGTRRAPASRSTSARGLQLIHFAPSSWSASLHGRECRRHEIWSTEGTAAGTTRSAIRRDSVAELIRGGSWTASSCFSAGDLYGTSSGYRRPPGGTQLGVQRVDLEAYPSRAGIGAGRILRHDGDGCGERRHRAGTTKVRRRKGEVTISPAARNDVAGADLFFMAQDNASALADGRPERGRSG